GCKAVTTSVVNFTWIDSDFLKDQGVTPWTELPLWLPDEEQAGLGQVNIERALSLGLMFRPLADTARDTIQWHKETRGLDYDFGATDGSFGMKAQREREILAAWHARSKPAP
ncbi:MAG: hypothetical protein V3T84_05300, partial [Phycisphaerales bacterium]